MTPLSERLKLALKFDAGAHLTASKNSAAGWDANERLAWGAGALDEHARTAPIVAELIACVEAAEKLKWMDLALHSKIDEHYQQDWYEEIKADAKPLEDNARAWSAAAHLFKDALTRLSAAIEGRG